MRASAVCHNDKVCKRGTAMLVTEQLPTRWRITACRLHGKIGAINVEWERVVEVVEPAARRNAIVAIIFALHTGVVEPLLSRRP